MKLVISKSHGILSDAVMLKIANRSFILNKFGLIKFFLSWIDQQIEPKYSISLDLQN